jgi:hypothetical protein
MSLELWNRTPSRRLCIEGALTRWSQSLSVNRFYTGRFFPHVRSLTPGGHLYCTFRRVARARRGAVDAFHGGVIPEFGLGMCLAVEKVSVCRSDCCQA